MNKQFNWYENATGIQRYTTLICVQAGNENKPNQIILFRLQT